MKNFLKQIDSRYLLVAVLLLTGLLLSFQNLDFYLDFDFRMLLVLAVSPFVLFVKYEGEYSIRYAILSLICLALYPVLKVQSCFFMGFSLFLMFVIESQLGKLNNLPVFFILVVSPFALFVFEVLGFPIRLELTDLATSALSFLNLEVSNTGNLIQMGEFEFSVDPECMGLKLTVTAFVISLCMMAFKERRTGKNIGLPATVALLGLTGILVVLTNLFRIVVIILFKAMPGTLSHELIGLMSLVVYCILPLWGMIHLIFTHHAKPTRAVNPGSNSKVVIGGMTLLLLGVLFTLNLNREQFRKDAPDPQLAALSLDGYDGTLLENGIMQFKNEQSMIYVKPPASFYSAEHTPMICWRGSGFDLAKENIENWAGQEVFTAELKTGTDSLFTAWWYDNGEYRTVSQLDWRWRAAIGEEPFRVINVTVADRKHLRREVEQIWKQPIFAVKRP